MSAGMRSPDSRATHRRDQVFGRNGRLAAVRLTRAWTLSICWRAVALLSALASWIVPTMALIRMTAKMKTHRWDRQRGSI